MQWEYRDEMVPCSRKLRGPTSNLEFLNDRGAEGLGIDQRRAAHCAANREGVA